MNLKLFDIFVFFYLIMDLITTYLGIFYGYGEEINAIFILYGHEVFLLVKVTVVLVILLLVKYVETHKTRSIKHTILTGLLIGLIICSVFVVINNILIYFDIELIKMVGIV